MLQYDLNIFSPIEFEDFSRNLLQRKLRVYMESFTPGKDEGIDFRISTKEGDIIIQTKRYENFRLLLNSLKKEVPKIKKLAPKSYIITTSVGLTPNNKKEIQNLFTPYIKSTEDIYGKNDLLNILAENGDIEEMYYKLWIGSIRVLKKVLQSKYNDTPFELRNLQDKIKVHVQNKSFSTSLSILKEHQYIIISGVPGIGKTTLSEALIHHYLSLDYEPVYLGEDISYKNLYLNDSKKQIFWFDDFLGENFFDHKNGTKRIHLIIEFIKDIRKAQNKLLILTTRENILNQAKEIYEKFKIENIEIAKNTIDLSIYTRLIRAKILYNHLFHAGIPQTHLNNLIENKNYEVLINHVNYNPRIIETIIKQKIWNSCTPDHFFEVIKAFFDNPKTVWLHSFENTIDRFSQYLLLVLFTLPSPVLIDDLETTTESFFFNNPRLGINYDPIQFLKSIRELENTFINTVKTGPESRIDELRIQKRVGGWDTSDPDLDLKGKIFVKYQNPSIYDFLFNYLLDKEKLVDYLLNSFIFIEQFHTLFSLQKFNETIDLDQTFINKVAARLLQIENNLSSCKINIINIGYNLHTYQKGKPFYIFLNFLYDCLSDHNKDIEEFVYRNFKTELSSEEFIYDSVYVDLLGKLDLAKFSINENKIFNNFLNYSFEIADLDLSSFEKLKLIFPDKYQKYIASKYFSNIINEKAKNAIKFCMGSGVIITNKVYDYRFRLEYITKNFQINLDKYIKQIDEVLGSIQFPEQNYEENGIEEEMVINEDMEDEMVIRNLFNKLQK
jgi:GTPase SAR1 family protein